MEAAARRTGLVLALGGLLIVVDTTVTIVALPAIVDDLGSTLSTVQWVTTGYVLGIVAVVPVAGWAAARFGDRRVYLVALVTFTLASVLAAAAWSAEALIGLRVLQGMGGGLLNPVGAAIGLRVVPRAARGRMMSLIGLPVVVGPVLGPPLSGLLVDALSWRWIFWINLPVGLVAIALCLRFLPPPPVAPGTRHPPVDLRGLVLVSGGAVAIVHGAALVGEAGGTTAASVVAVGGGVLLLAAFTAHALRVPHPLLDLRLLRRPPLATGAVVLVFFTAGYFGAMIIGPVLVQGVRGDPALVAGVLGVPTGIAVGLTLQVATRLVDRLPPQRIVVAGTSVAVLGASALALATAVDALYPVLAGCGVVLGVGSGATLMPVMTNALRDLEGPDTPRGTTLLALLSQLGTAVGTAVVTTALSLAVDRQVPELATTGDGGVSAMVALDDGARAALQDDLARAVATSYLVVIALLVVAAGAAALSGRRTRHRPSSTRRHASARNAP